MSEEITNEEVLEAEITRNYVFYVLLSEDSTTLGSSEKRDSIIYNPLIDIWGVLPKKFFFTLNIGIQHIISPTTRLSAIMYSPYDKELFNIDLNAFITENDDAIKMDDEYETYFYRGMIVLKTQKGIMIEHEGVHRIEIVSDGEIIHESILVVTNIGANDE